MPFQEIRVIIVEDHMLAVNRLKRLLLNQNDFKVIGAFDTTQSALPILESGRVEGVFLDIDFNKSGGGETDGLILASNISRLLPSPWIIFISAHPQYVFEAIRKLPPNVFYDFICIPYTETDLDTALNKVRNMPRPAISANVTLPMQRTEIRYTKRAEIQGRIDSARITTFIDIEDILYIHQNLVVEVHLKSREILSDVNIKLQQWEKLLCTHEVDYFQRIHKKTIVNLKFANGIRPDPEAIDGHLAIFQGYTDQPPIGRTYLAAYREAIRTGKRTAESDG